MTIRKIIGRPLSTITASLGSLGFLFSFYFLIVNGLYVDALDNVDVTTVLMISLLLLKGVYVYKDRSDLKAFSLALINALSFIFLFEAVYKFFFFSWVVDSPELRELLLQIASALTVLAGFAFEEFSLNRRAMLFLIIYSFLMLIWVLVGYPQLFEMPTDTVEVLGMEINGYPQIIQINLSKTEVYILNRAAKIMLFLGYFFIYDRDK